MKMIINLIVYFFFLTSILGQDISIDYNFIHTTNSFIAKSNLFIPNDSISIFEIYEKNNDDYESENNEYFNRRIVINKPVYLNRVVVKNKINDSLYYYKPDLLKNKKYIKIKEKLSGIKWKLTSETKNILGYNCIEAIGKYKGKEYVAWFSEQLPYSDGPWKFSGLPGLILEIESDDGTLSIKADKITLNSIRNYKKKNISYIKEYTWDEYVIEMKKLLKKMEKFAISSTTNNVVATIELNEPDYTIKNE